jgi:4-O-beta-D-mannosyl-D-glucose phosphorylase
MRYVLYLFLCDLNDPSRVTHRPGGYFMAPESDERIGDVSNVLFANGWILRPDGRVLIYYGSSDTRTHVAVSSLDHLLDYVLHTPPDPLRSRLAVEQRRRLIQKNLRLVQKK